MLSEGTNVAARRPSGEVRRRASKPSSSHAAIVALTETPTRDLHERLQWREATGIWTDMTTTLRTARRIVVAVVGGTITLLGVVLLVLPGPAFVVIPIGLSILATEFVWARQWLTKVKEVASKAVGSKS